MKIPFFYCALLITTISGLCYVFEPTIIAKQYLNTLKKQTTEWANTLSQNPTKQHEKPTNNGYARYIEQMHRAAPGTNWRDIDHQTRLQLHRQHTQNQPALRDNNLFETLANGNLNGYWREIGSNNLAGRIVHADYDTSSNTIYAASISGSVWQSPADGSNWTVLNDKFRLSKIRTLHLIPNNAGTKRLLAWTHYAPISLHRQRRNICRSANMAERLGRQRQTICPMDARRWRFRNSLAIKSQ